MEASYSRRGFLNQVSKFALAAPALCLVGCEGENARTNMNTFSGSTMGTSYSVKIAGVPESKERVNLKAGMERILQIVNEQMSTWRNDSEISKFNNAATLEWTVVSPWTFKVINEAMQMIQLSKGAFDPTIGPLIDLWGFGPGEGEKGLPPLDRIQLIFERQHSNHVRIRGLQSSIAKTNPSTELDLSGIAKGFAVDRIAAYLDGRGLKNYLVEIGGELKARGFSPYLRPWRIGIEKPVNGVRAIQRIVSLEGQAIATSGNYKNFFENDGLIFSHILDPRTGRPITHDLASVTVLAPTAINADALSTALMVLGPDRGIRLARNKGIAALFILKKEKSFIEVSTSEFKQYQFG